MVEKTDWMNIVGHAPSSGKSNFAIQSIGRSLRAGSNVPIMIYDIESYDISSMYPFSMKRPRHLTKLRRERDDKTPWWKRVIG